MSCKRAFTLIELLIVIGIIIILAALLLPVLMTARNKARQMQCGSNLRQIGMAIQLYSGDHDDLPPMGAYDAVVPPPLPQLPAPSGTGTALTYRIDWTDVLCGMLYLKNRAVLTCPSAQNDDCRWSYGVNRWVMGWRGAVKIDALPSPSQTALVSEKVGFDWPIWLPGEDRANPYYRAMDPRHSNSLNVLFADGHVKSTAVGEPIESNVIIWRWQQ